MGKEKEEMGWLYLEGKEEWVGGDEGLGVGVMDGMYDGEGVGEESRGEEVFEILNKGVEKGEKKSKMNLEEVKKGGGLKKWVRDEDFVGEVGVVEREGGKVGGVDGEVRGEGWGVMVEKVDRMKKQELQNWRLRLRS